MYWPLLASTGTVRTPSLSSCSFPVGSFTTSTAVKSMPFFERNSFVLRQLLQPGWVNRINLSATLSMIESDTVRHPLRHLVLGPELIISSSKSRRNLLESRSNSRRLGPRIQLFQETALVEIVR